jgi:NADH-quinone oxidoreductase subunit A
LEQLEGIQIVNTTLVSFLAILIGAVGLPLAMLAITSFIGPSRYAAQKLEPYEAGVTSTIGTARERFSIKFYLVAILFIVFDVEAVFLFPWAVNFRGLGMYGLVEMFVFIGVLFAGYIYIVKKGALKWD